MAIENKVVEIPVVQIKPPANEMRESMSHEGIEELRESISQHGLISPVTVVKMGELYEIVAGARRFEAVKSLGHLTIKAQIIDGGDREIEEVKIHENLKREDVDPIEEGAYYARLIYEKGWNLDEVQKSTGKSMTYLERRLMTTKWDECVKNAIRAKAISLSVAEEIMKFEGEEIRERYVTAAANNGVTARTMESWRQQHEAAQAVPASHDGGNGENVNQKTKYIPATYCAVCGENLHGIVTHYVPVSQRCLEVLMDARAAESARGKAG